MDRRLAANSGTFPVIAMFAGKANATVCRDTEVHSRLMYLLE
jgi:hypothetical protein